MDSKRGYTLNKAIKDYGARSIAEGLDMVLASEIKVDTELSGDNDFLDRIYNCPQFTDEAEGKVAVLRAAMPYEGYTGLTCDTVLILDEADNELVRSSCSCDSFQKNLYSCRHVMAVLGKYFLDKEGVQVFENTEVEKELKKISGIDTPFVPGILRKTDKKLSNLIETKKKSDKDSSPAWLVNPKNENSKNNKTASDGLISVECAIKLYPDKVLVEIKAGPKKKFVIKQFRSLLEIYDSNAPFSFSSTLMMPAGRRNYSEDSRKLMDFFSGLYNNSQRTKKMEALFPTIVSGVNTRLMQLRGRDLDAFMKLIDGSGIEVTDLYNTKIMCTVSLDAEPTPVKLVKKEFGAEMNIPDQCILGVGIDYVYVVDEERIIKLPQEQWNQRSKLDSLHGSSNLYVRDMDLPALCSNLLTELNESGQLVTEGFDLDEFRPEIPQIQIYLDIIQGNMISCELFALYKSGKKYHIYDRKKNAKKRNLAAEQPFGEAVWPLFSSFEEGTSLLYLECSESMLFTFLTDTIPMLAKIGEIYVSDNLKKLKVRPAGTVNAGINVETESLSVSLKSNTMDINEIAEILSRYDRKKNYTRLKNGEFITFNEQDIDLWAALSETYKAYGRKNPEAMKVPVFRALYLNELLNDRDEVVFSADDKFRTLISRINCETKSTARLPEQLKEILRPYQKDGFRWISMLKENGLGGILADDMGLGKTVQVLSFLLSEFQRGKKGDDIRTLIIAPASLIYNWKREISIFTPELKCAVVSGSQSQRKEILDNISDADIFITSYDLLKRDVAEYDGIKFANEVIDEAQYIKNQNTMVSKAVRVINSGFRLALTGTPIENRLSELWSIFDYLMPGFLYNYSRFREEFETLIMVQHDEKALKNIRKMVHPFILRRMKGEVLRDLPDKIEETVTIRLEDEQRKIYDAYAERLKLYIDKQNEEEFSQSKIEILAELTKLRQICCGPEIFLESYKGANAKKEACMELIRQAIDGGHKILLFSQFTKLLDELCGALNAAEIKYHRIDGSVDKEKRIQMVSSFDKDDVPVFCVSLKAGGTGLNLTAADIVIHYDPWWNIAAQNQATDRAHRIGQNKMVTVYQLIAEDTIEEQIVKLQQTKAQLAKDILEGEGISSILIDKEALLNLL